MHGCGGHTQTTFTCEQSISRCIPRVLCGASAYTIYNVHTIFYDRKSGRWSHHHRHQSPATSHIMAVSMQFALIIFYLRVIFLSFFSLSIAIRTVRRSLHEWAEKFHFATRHSTCSAFLTAPQNGFRNPKTKKNVQKNEPKIAKTYSRVQRAIQFTTKPNIFIQLTTKFMIYIV